MIRADLVAPSHEDQSCRDGQNFDPLHKTHQNFAAKNTVDQKQRARDQPDQPSQTTDPPRASLNKQVMYLRVVCHNDKRCSHPAYNFHISPQQLRLKLPEKEANVRAARLLLEE
jgi:hypothetical protein